MRHFHTEALNGNDQTPLTSILLFRFAYIKIENKCRYISTYRYSFYPTTAKPKGTVLVLAIYVCLYVPP